MRILVDPDDPARKPKPPVTYKLSPEEIEKLYGPIKGGTGPRTAIATLDAEETIKDMKKKGDVEMNINEEIKCRVAAGEDINEIVDDMAAAGKSRRIVARYASAFGYRAKYPSKKKPKAEPETKSYVEVNPKAIKFYIASRLENAEKVLGGGEDDKK